MSSLAQLREEHAELVKIVAELRVMVDGAKPPATLALYDVRRRLTGTLIAHLKAEDWLLYPPLLEYLSQFLRAAILVTRTNEARRDDFSSQVRDEHKAIYDAIAAKDPDAARRAILTHIDNAGARIQAAGPAFWAGEGSAAAQPLLAQGKRAVRRKPAR